MSVLRALPFHGIAARGCLWLVLCGCAESPDQLPPTQAVLTGNRGPIASFEKTVIDLGDVSMTPAEQQLVTEIPFLNAGDEELRFVRMVLSCGCASAQPANSGTDPDEVGHLRIKANMDQPGSQSVTINAYPNEREGGVHHLVVRWNAIPPFSVTPGSIDFNTLLPEQTASSHVDVGMPSTAQCRDAVITSIEASTDKLSAAWDGKRLNVQLSPGSEPGVYQGKVTVTLADCWRDQVSIPVNWKVASQLAVEPGSIFLGAVAAAATVERRIVIRTLDGSHMIVGSDAVDSESQLVRSTDVDRLKNDVGVLTLHLMAPSVKGPFNDKLTIRLEEPAGYQATLHVSGYVEE